MLFKLSMKNIKKSIKDYTIYFMTLILGIGVFYVFNSMDAQIPIINLSKSSSDVVKLMINMLSGLSVFISIVLGFLIMYANNFLIKRRKKEFGVYLTLGMGKGQLSKILFFETLFIGIISLFVGLILGVFVSQFMSVVVAGMFEADMSNFKFVFSSQALIKTVMYFSIVYIFVMIFNTFVVSKYKLIDLLTGGRKSEKIKLRNPIVSVFIFVISVIMLGYSYYNVTANAMNLTENEVLKYIAIGAVATFLFFFSLSGFVLKLVQSNKRLYYKNLNMFVLKQINSKINTTVISMSLICLMLFTTIGMLSSGLAMNNAITSDLRKYNPVDISINKNMNLNESDGYSNSVADFSKKDIRSMLKDMGYDVNKNFNNVVEVSGYTSEEVKLKDTLKNILPEVKELFPRGDLDAAEEIMKVSDYNKVARLFGNEEVHLNNNEYGIVCNYDNIKNLRDKALKSGTKITLNGKTYTPGSDKCYDGFVENSIQGLNFGIIIVPDDVTFGYKQKEINYFNANYKVADEEQKLTFEKNLKEDVEQNSKFKDVKDMSIKVTVLSKIDNYASSKGIGATVTFIGIYLGIIFLITSAAILALKELSESTDNIERYSILRKIGASNEMINRALFMQIGIFFMLPLLLAVIHSIFGLQFADIILSTFGHMNILPSITVTAVVIVLIYGGYFLITYFSSKNIIREK
ncbi:ABC transporter permease [Anaerofustis sp.]|uniref:ABC transporter permease n=1 Tax=Anaerofustis sp. TaxID=1872517 RepID=UPI0025C2EC79|nr:ABC transporter permease [Anaerofustis sp.]